MNDTAANTTATLDPEHPWLGLDSYTEATRGYFHGRYEETAELARRVQSKNLTILFGQSGLGKTSLLRAGLVPRLRPEGYCPVYVRIDYAPDSPPPAQQIRQAIFKVTLEAGVWTRPGASGEGDSLWELLHHHGDLLRDANGKPLLPLLIFDQFEEIFTLGQVDDAGRERAREFLADLADLVENRPPEAFEKRLDEDDALAEEFDFERADYRVLITLREDYLAYLESLKGTMPSITQNRMRLARMTGTQALDAVIQPGGMLVTREVAEAIVRFVAGGSELANAEIEPSLLSLVCRELNNARLAQGRTEISADLLAGSRDTILAEFYERSLADQPDGVRRVIEDELLTDSGYRESLAEERVLKLLADAGAGPDTLATLVNRRLLRIEERLDMRRVELTHDVLCGVVAASRNTRREREAREAAEAELEAQRQREAEAHRKLKRARLTIDVCIVLILLAVAGAAFGFYNMHRAQKAEAQAQASRTHAESLVSFLIEDFYTDLAPTGRLEVLGKLAKKTVAYYDTLPPNLVTRQTKINRSMAMLREAAAQRASGKLDAADKNFTAARGVFQQMYDAGDHSEPVVYGLALALQSQGSNSVLGNPGHGTVAQLKKAVDLLKPLAHRKGASRRIRQLYADALNYWQITIPPAQQLHTTTDGLKILAGLGALDVSDPDAATTYADMLDTRARALLNARRIDDARAAEQRAYSLAGRVLAKQPGNRHALTDRYYTAQLLSGLASLDHDPAAALDWARKSAQAGEDGVRFNPSDLNNWGNWASGLGAVAQTQFGQGEISQAIATIHSILALAKDPRVPSSLAPMFGYGAYRLGLAEYQARIGDVAAARRALAGYQKDVNAVMAQLSPTDPQRPLEAESVQYGRAYLQLMDGHARQALATITVALHRIDAIKVRSGSAAEGTRNNVLSSTLVIATLAALREGEYVQAETFAHRLQKLPLPNSNYGTDPRQIQSENTILLAYAVAGQGKHGEARKTLQPALSYYAAQAKAGAGSTQFRRRYATALYVDAISQPATAAGRKQRAADLATAQAQIDDAPKEVQQLVPIRHVASLIAAARH